MKYLSGNCHNFETWICFISSYLVFVYPYSNWDFRKIADNNKAEEFEFFLIHYFETVLKEIEVRSKCRKEGQPPVTQFVTIFDVNQYAFSQMLNFTGKYLDNIICKYKGSFNLHSLFVIVAFKNAFHFPLKFSNEEMVSIFGKQRFRNIWHGTVIELQKCQIICLCEICFRL